MPAKGWRVQPLAAAEFVKECGEAGEVAGALEKAFREQWAVFFPR